MSTEARQSFWREVASLRGTALPRVAARTLTFGAVAGLVCLAALLVEHLAGKNLSIEVAPHEFAGAALGVLLVVRTNAGYDRWWEARKLWGGFVDRCRNLAISARAYGPDDPAWRASFAGWLAAYPHVGRLTLRDEPPSPEVVALVGPEEAARLGAAEHMPSFVSWKLAELLRQAREQLGMEHVFFLQVDGERLLLINQYGGCERIRNTPLPKVYSTAVRQLVALYLVTLPFALLHRLGSDWLVPLVTMLTALPLLSLDEIGVGLENPFLKSNLSHLPIDGICQTIEGNVLGVLNPAQPETPGV